MAIARGFEREATQIPSGQSKPGGLSSLLPTGGGIGGALAGGAAGAALGSVVPVIGTGIGGLLGAILGGAGGSALGKFGENAAEDQKDLGQGVAQEAALGGLTSLPVGGALKVGGTILKGVTGLGKATVKDTLEKAGQSAIPTFATGLRTKAASEIASKTPGVVQPTGVLSNIRSKLADTGTTMEARAGGFGVGEKDSGKQLGFFDSKAIGDNLTSEGIKSGSPTARLKQVETKLQQYGKNIDTTIKDTNVSLSETDRHQIATDFMNTLEHTPGVTQGAIRHGKQEVSTFLASKNGDLKGLVDFKRGLDKNAINYKASTDAATGDRQLASTAFRDTLKKAIDDRAPEIKDLNNSYHNLSTAAGFLKGGAKSIADMSQGQGGGLISRVLSGQTAEAAKSAVGGKLKTLGKPLVGEVPPGVAEAFGVPKGNGILGTVARESLLGGRPQLGAPQTPEQATDANGNPVDTVNGIPIGQTQSATSGTSDGTTPVDGNNLFTAENVQNLIAQDLEGNGGKNVSSLVALYNAFGKPDTSKSLNSTQQQQANNATSALQDIQTISTAIQNDPTITLKANAPGSLGQRLAGTTDFDAAKANVIDVISRLRSGAAISASEEKLYKSLLPSTFDSPEAAQSKLQRLQSLFTSFANPSASSTGSTDVSDAVSAAQ